MHSDAFEKAFSDFLDSKDCEGIYQAFTLALRAAFAAGWKAAELEGEKL